MSRFVLTFGLCLLVGIPAGAAVSVQEMLRGIEQRYNRPRTLQFQFEQSEAGRGRITRTESGTLSLRKPGRMRWDYTAPEGKLFLSDGKFVYFFNPLTMKVSRSKLRESDDMRAPLAFLMGRLDFHRDFKKFRTTPEGEDTYVIAEPKSDKAPYTQVAFLVTPDYRIKMLRVNGQDQSIMVYRLENEQTNPSLADGMFQFKMPAGAILVDEEEIE
ncbi:MAG: outer membrane lipoprotein chaperone LolA [Bryobacteraceae bacterium]